MRWIWWLAVLTWVAAEVPPTQLHYLSPKEELKLAVAIKREYYPWPALKVGVGQSRRNWFCQVRFWVNAGAGRAQVIRQCRQVGLLAFRLFPALAQIDIDACPADDNAQSKAIPWFAASLQRREALELDLGIPPQRWFEKQGPVTLRSELHKEGDPSLSLAQALSQEWSK